MTGAATWKLRLPISVAVVSIHVQVTAFCRAETGTTAEIRRRYADVLETRTCASSDTAEREKCNLELYSLRHRQPV